jgi:uncharacterized metal-binding protein
MSIDAQCEPARNVLAYSCSGASNLGQLANEIASRLDRLGLVDMACLTAIASGNEQSLAAATSGRPVLAISGCSLACADTVFADRGVPVSRSISLADSGVLKAKHSGVEAAESERIFREKLREVEPFLRDADETAGPLIDAAFTD